MKKLTTEEFIERAKSVHGDKYDYSKVDYVDSKTKVCIICPKHGEFWQTPNDHLDGHDCKKCIIEERAKRQTKTSLDFIERAREVHGDKYDYSKVNYIDAQTKVCIICPIHGEFWQKPYAHLNGQNCPLCSHRNTKYTVEEFIEKAREVHGNKYDYSKVKYINKDKKICIICPIHGEFWQTPHNHIQGKQGCPKCKNSKLENDVMDYLEKTQILYNYQYRNTDFLGKQSLDFYLPQYGFGIECQGIQHFEKVSFGGEIDKETLFQLNQQRDNLKIQKCKENNIKLIHYVPFEKYFGTYENEVHNIEELKKLLTKIPIL